jgi:hypothetical protein
MDTNERIHWARKVSQAKIRRLYQTDALGIVDEELIDDVGSALYARCQSILLVSSAQVECPRCGCVFQVEVGRPEEDVLACPADGCFWQTTYRQWHNSWRHQDLIGTRAASAFQVYVKRYQHAKGPREKMFLIDQLIHAFHQGIIAGMPHRSAANNLIEGSHRQVVAFLDQLTFGDGSTPGLKERQAEWREKAKAAERVRRSVR